MMLQKARRLETVGLLLLYCRSVLVAALGADAEVKLLHAFDLVADALEGAHRAVGRQALENMGQRAGNVVGLLGGLLHGGVIEAGRRDED